MPRRDSTRQERTRLAACVAAVIAQNYGDPALDLPAVARECTTSTRQLQRVMREELGAGFRAYLLDVRMQRARALLETQHSSRETAARVGYRDAPNFAKTFRRCYGRRPFEVRRAARQDR